ncbi:MAG: hypothetical protein R3E96_07985 [Planctomycetota bacterium]
MNSSGRLDQTILFADLNAETMVGMRRSTSVNCARGPIAAAWLEFTPSVARWRDAPWTPMQGRANCAAS